MNKMVTSEQKLLEKIRQLSPEKVIEVENFIDLLVQQDQNTTHQTNWDKEIVIMASDSEIQAEIAAINVEFAIAIQSTRNCSSG